MFGRMSLGGVALAGAVALGGCMLASPAGYDFDDIPPGCAGQCADSGAGDGGYLQPGADGGLPVFTPKCTEPSASPGILGSLRQGDAGNGLLVSFEPLVVTDVESVRVAPDGGVAARLWVVMPCTPGEGLMVDKAALDAPAGYLPRPGDVVRATGLYGHYDARADGGPESAAYRPVLRAAPDAGPVLAPVAVMQRPADVAVDAGFGDADGGNLMADPELAGARVHVPGRLVITQPSPPAFARADGGSDGFEVSGGVLVYTGRLARADGGAGCDWRAVALDGGNVVFPDGVRGTWETYTQVPPCTVQVGLDGGSVCVGGAEAQVPGTNPAQPYTYVLYPSSCATDLAAVVDAGAY